MDATSFLELALGIVLYFQPTVGEGKNVENVENVFFFPLTQLCLLLVQNLQ